MAAFVVSPYFIMYCKLYVWSFEIKERFLCCFEYTVLHEDLLEDVSSVAFIITAHKQTQ